MKKKAAYLTLFIAVLAGSVFLVKNYFSAWDVTGDVREVHKNETSYSIEVKTGLISGGQKYNITIDRKSEIILDGYNIEFVNLNLSPNNKYRVKAVTGDTALFSDPPVVGAEIIEIDER